MTIKELIKKRDYDYISLRALLPIKLGGGEIFYGVCKSENGKLIPLDDDTYDENTEVIDWEEWVGDEKEHSLTILFKME